MNYYMNQKGFVNIVLIVVIVAILVGTVGYFVFVKKSGPVTQEPAPTSNITPLSSNSKPSITVLSPNGGEKYQGGKTYDIKWLSNSIKSNVDIGLVEGSEGSGQGAGYVALNVRNSGLYKWTISSNLQTGEYKIFIRPVRGGFVEDVSDSTFTITAVPLTLSNSEALALVKATWGVCTPDSCSEVLVSVSNTGGVIYVTATYEGLRDDSSSASRKVAPAHYDYGYKAWVLETPITTQRCQPGRGHQDFSSVLCL